MRASNESFAVSDYPYLPIIPRLPPIRLLMRPISRSLLRYLSRGSIAETFNMHANRYAISQHACDSPFYDEDEKFCLTDDLYSLYANAPCKRPLS